jgi:hypothetical protein
MEGGCPGNGGEALKLFIPVQRDPGPLLDSGEANSVQEAHAYVVARLAASITGFNKRASREQIGASE